MWQHPLFQARSEHVQMEQNKNSSHDPCFVFKPFKPAATSSDNLSGSSNNLPWCVTSLTVRYSNTCELSQSSVEIHFDGRQLGLRMFTVILQSTITAHNMDSTQSTEVSLNMADHGLPCNFGYIFSVGFKTTITPNDLYFREGDSDQSLSNFKLFYHNKSTHAIVSSKMILTIVDTKYCYRATTTNNPQSHLRV